MCIQITKYHCGHERTEKKECRWYRLDLISAQNERRKRGFFTNLFSRPEKVPCPLPPGIKELMYEDCPICIKEKKRTDKRPREPPEEVMSREEFERTRLDMKWAWTCNACFSEDRQIEHFQRVSNGGTCCARGLDEFQTWEERQGYRSMNSKYQSRTPHAKFPSEVGQPQQSHKHDPGYLTAKLDATKAANDNGWSPNYDGLEPHLAAQFVNMTGIQIESLPPPPPPSRSPEPFYQDAGIDSERWEGARRTEHGSYPAPESPPESPLPVRPLRPTSPTTTRVSTRKQAQSTKSSGGKHGSTSQTFSAPKRPNRGSSTHDTRNKSPRTPATTTPPLPFSTTIRPIKPVANPFSLPSSSTPSSTPSTLPRSSLRKPIATAASAPRSKPLHSTAAPSGSARSSSKQIPSTSGPSKLSSRPRAATPGPSTLPTISSRSATLKAKSSPSSSTKPLPKDPNTSRHQHTALKSGRKVTLGSSRGPVRPQATIDDNGVSPPTSPALSGTSPVSPMSDHALKGKKSVFHELKGEIDSTMDCFSDNEEFKRGRAW